MPFIGGRTPSVMAHANRDDGRIDKFVLFIGGAATTGRASRGAAR
jgi:hypothetical protein